MLHLTLLSDLESLNQVESIIGQLQTQIGFSDDIAGNVMMALHEAVTNAIIHGNKLDPTKLVELDVLVENGQFLITVSDQGPGFDPDSLPDPLDEANLLKSGGRGVFLIRQFADEVRFNDKGNQITLCYHL